MPPGSLLGALRRSLRSPIFVVLAAATLAIGTGVTTAAYEVIATLLPGARRVLPSNLFVVTDGNGGVASMSLSDYGVLHDRDQAFEGLAAYSTFSTAVSAGHVTRLVSAEVVTGDYFAAMDAKPARGRLFREPDSAIVDIPPVVISYDLWLAVFGKASNAVGSEIRVANQVAAVVGVTDDSFNGLHQTLGSKTAVWIPLALAARIDDPLWQTRRGTGVRDAPWLSVLGRLRPGWDVARVSSEVGAIAAGLDRMNDASLGAGHAAPTGPSRAWSATPARSIGGSLLAGRDIERVVVLLPALVFAVACSNLMNLVLFRAQHRGHELGVRAALGATRADLFGEIVAEIAGVVVLGTAAGALIADAIFEWAVTRLNAPLAAIHAGLDLLDRARPSGMTTTITCFAMAFVIAGVIPAYRLTGSNPARSLTLPSGIVGGFRRGARTHLIATQVAVALGLSLVTVLLGRFVADQTQVGDRLASGLHDVAVAYVPYASEQRDAEYAWRSAERVTSSAPSGILIAAASSLPTAVPWVPWPDTHVLIGIPGRLGPGATGLPDGAAGLRSEGASMLAVSSHFFDVLGVRPVRGRTIDDRDSVASRPVVVVEEGLARSLFGTEEVIGQSISWTQERPPLSVKSTGAAEIVGVVPDHDNPQAVRGAPRSAYVPLAQRHQPTVVFLAKRPAGGSAPVAELLIDIRQSDSNAAVQVASTGDVVTGVQRVVGRFISVCCGALALISLALSMAGLYGLMSQSVRRRTREIGLRLAIGASPRDVFHLVVGEGMRPVAEGAACAVVLALIVRQLTQSALTARLEPVDLWTWALAVAPAIAAGLVACYWPARWASRLDPSRILQRADER